MLKSCACRVKGVEEKLNKIVSQQGSNVDEVCTLVKEYDDIQKEMKVNFCPNSQDLYSELLQLTVDIEVLRAFTYSFRDSCSLFRGYPSQIAEKTRGQGPLGHYLNGHQVQQGSKLSV